jgi:hypothetical protein
MVGFVTMVMDEFRSDVQRTFSCRHSSASAGSKSAITDQELKVSLDQSDSMTEFSVTLSSAGFANVDLGGRDDDFEFIVEGSRFRCSRLAASFLSPKIAKLLLVDRTMNCYSIRTVWSGGIF